MTDNEFNELFNTNQALARIALIDFAQLNGMTQVETHIHFTFGSVDFDEGF